MNNTFIKRELKNRLTFTENLCISSRYHMENGDYKQVAQNIERIIEILQGKVELKDVIYHDWRDKGIEAQKNNE